MINDNDMAVARLQVIADLLGIPMQEMIAGATHSRFWADNECLHLWCSLKTDAGRNAALDALRKIAAVDL